MGGPAPPAPPPLKAIWRRGCPRPLPPNDRMEGSEPTSKIGLRGGGAGWAGWRVGEGEEVSSARGPREGEIEGRDGWRWEGKREGTREIRRAGRTEGRREVHGWK